MNSTTWLVSAASFVIALLAPLALIPLLERIGAVDMPNSRSSHSHRALRGGGLAQALAIGCSIVLALVLSIRPSGLLTVALLVLVTTALLGWLEDVSGLPEVARAGGQFAIGLLAAGIASIQLDRTPLWCLVGGIAVLGLVNVVNFMDGVNTMSAFHAIIAGITFVVIGSLDDREWLVALGAILAAAFIAFIPWNFNGRLFLGDTGSYLFGGLAAITVVMAWMDRVSLVALVSPFVIYVADTGVTLISRVFNDERWHEAHRDHTYQRLSQHGLTHVRTASVVGALSLICAVLGIAYCESTGAIQFVYIAGIGVAVAGYTSVRIALGPAKCQ